MHHVKNIFMLAVDHNTDLLAQIFKLFCKFTAILFTFCCVCDHHHVEVPLNDGLGDIQNVNLILCKVCTNLCDNSYCVISYYCDNCLLNRFFLSTL